MARPHDVDPVPTPVYFVDRCLGRGDVPAALEAAGACVERHDDHFPHDCPDETWLVEVARRGWAVLTKDRRIRRRPAERAALLSSGSAAFFLTAGDLSGADAARAFVHALPRIERLLLTRDRPLIALVTASGQVTILDGRRRGGVRRDGDASAE